MNPALVEPFGLTLIEAAAYGLPMVATKNGGPVDIQRVSASGLVIRCETSDDVRSCYWGLPLANSGGPNGSSGSERIPFQKSVVGHLLSAMGERFCMVESAEVADCESLKRSN